MTGGDSSVAAAPSASSETVPPSDSGERGCAPALAGPLGAGSREAPDAAIRALTAVCSCGSSTG